MSMFDAMGNASLCIVQFRLCHMIATLRRHVGVELTFLLLSCANANGDGDGDGKPATATATVA